MHAHAFNNKYSIPDDPVAKMDLYSPQVFMHALHGGETHPPPPAAASSRGQLQASSQNYIANRLYARGAISRRAREPPLARFRASCNTLRFIREYGLTVELTTSTLDRLLVLSLRIQYSISTTYYTK